MSIIYSFLIPLIQYYPACFKSELLLWKTMHAYRQTSRRTDEQTGRQSTDRQGHTHTHTGNNTNHVGTYVRTFACDIRAWLLLSRLCLGLRATIATTAADIVHHAVTYHHQLLEHLVMRCSTCQQEHTVLEKGKSRLLPNGRAEAVRAQ